jgi:hypothetical protein
MHAWPIITEGKRNVSNFTTIADVIRDRQERGIADLLLSAYDAGYCAGAGVPCLAPINLGMRELLAMIAMRHQSEVLALRQWSDPPISRDDPPSWLLSLPQQADNPQLRAAVEQVIALENERPHDWIRGIADEGRP